MNKITHEESKHSLIKIPPFDGLGTFKIKYEHELTKPLRNILKVKLKVILFLEEIMGDRLFPLMNTTSKYRVNIEEKLVVEDLAYIWNESATFLIGVFNGFEKQKFGKPSEIKSSSTEELAPDLLPLVEWYSKLP